MRRAIRILLGVCLVMWLGWRTISDLWYRDFLPSQIGVAGLLAEGDDFNPLLLLAYFIRHEACGGVVFRLLPETVTAIEREGLNFFAEARVGRGHRHWRYLDWRETPVPWLHHKRTELDCMGWTPWNGRLRAALGQPGSYYSLTGYGSVVVVPAMGVALIGYEH
jgi:hypothetical protein